MEKKLTSSPKTKSQNSEKKRSLPKWKQGFNIVYSADEHCMSKSARSNPIKKSELSIRSAVLFNAMADIRLGEGPLFKGAIDWLNGRVKSMPGYSFIDICNAFNISHKAAREAILQGELKI